MQGDLDYNHIPKFIGTVENMQIVKEVWAPEIRISFQGICWKLFEAWELRQKDFTVRAQYMHDLCSMTVQNDTRAALSIYIVPRGCEIYYYDFSRSGLPFDERKTKNGEAAAKALGEMLIHIGIEMP